MAEGLMQDRNGKWLKVGDWCYIDDPDYFTQGTLYRLEENEYNDDESCAFYNPEKDDFWFCFPEEVTYTHVGDTSSSSESQVDEVPGKLLKYQNKSPPSKNACLTK